MIDFIVSSLAVNVGKRVLRAAIENRDLGRGDASEVVVAFLQAVVTGQQEAASNLERLEAQIGEVKEQSYSAAMHAGTRLLQDAAPAHRLPSDRRSMLNDARLRFADAAGFTRDAVELARAETMYGLTWLALGSPSDLRDALVRASTRLQREVVIAFQLRCRDELEWQRSRTRRSTQWREAIIGANFTMPDWTNSNRFLRAMDEYAAVLTLTQMTQGTKGSFPSIPRPHGSAYDHPRPGLPIRLGVAEPAEILGVVVILSPDGLVLDNQSGTRVRAALIPASMGTDNVISPDVSAVDQGGSYVAANSTGRLAYSGPGRPMACLILGREEQVDLAVLLHTEWDWPFMAERRRLLRMGPEG